MIAAIAQLVERNLAKVEVASPSLVCRSILSCETTRFSFVPRLDTFKIFISI